MPSGIGFSIWLNGEEELLSKLNEALKNRKDDVVKAARMEAELIMTESKLQCPSDTGALKSSGHVKEPYDEGGRTIIEFGYGGTAAKINPKTGESTDTYAVYVHENLEAHHPTGKAKFLEDPVKAAQPSLLKNIVERLK